MIISKPCFTLSFIILALVSTGNLNAQKWDFIENLHSSGDVTPIDILADNNGNIYVFGSYADDLTIDGLPTLKWTDLNGFEDLFICKYDASGNALWARKIASSNRDYANGMTIDNNNNVYIIGVFKGDTLNFWEGTGILNTDLNSFDTFLAKISSTGSLIYATKVLSGFNNQRLHDITYDFSNDYLVMAGNFKNEAIFGNDIDTAYALSIKDNCLVRFDIDGNYIDNAIFFGNQTLLFNNVSNCVISDVVTGYYVTGNLTGNIFSSDSSQLLAANDMMYTDIMVLNLDGNMDFVWGRSGGGSLEDYLNASGSDAYGNIYFTGRTESDTMRMDSTGSILSDPLIGYGWSDYYVGKYNKDGRLQWIRREGGWNYDNAYGLSVKGQRLLYAYDLEPTMNNFSTGFKVCDLDGNLLFSDSITGSGIESTLCAAFNQSGSAALLTGTFDGDTLYAGDLTITNPNFGFTDGFAGKYAFKFKLNLAGSTDIQCHGENTGSILLETENAADPVTYAWTPNVSTTNIATGIAAGTYKIVATDNEGRKDSVEVELTEPPAIAITEVSITGTSCNTAANSGIKSDGVVNINVTGGVPNYSYSWSPGGLTTQDISNVATGNHTVTVTDANSCTKMKTFNVPEPDPVTYPGTTIDTIIVPPGSNGAVNLNTEGGTAPYSWSWAGPSGYTAGNIETITELVNPGEYTVTVTDNKSCVFDTVIHVPSDTLLVIEICDTTHVSCKGGSDGAAKVCVLLGFSGNYLYEWRNSLYQPVGTNSAIVNGLTAGTYIVRVTDIDAGVWTEASVTIEEPALIHSVDFDPVHVGCFGGADGSITTTVTGDGEFTYLWETGQETKDIEELAAGWYKVKVTHSAGCFIYDSVEVLQPTRLTTDITDSTNVSIFGGNDGSATVTPADGTPPYTYQWEDGLSSTDSTATGLYAEIWYHVTVTDDHSCTTRDSVILSEPGIFHAEITDSTDASCNGLSDGSASVSSGGGVPPYTILWNDDEGSTTETITGLSPNRWYTVIVTDATLQTVKDSVYLGEADPITISKTYSESICSGSTDGYIHLSVSGGTPPYSIEWSNSETTPEINNLEAGEYSVVITDENSCTAHDTATIETSIIYEGSELCLVTVNNNNRILVVWEKTYGKGIAYYNIYREQSSKDNYVKIETVDFDSLSVYVDPSSVPEENPYFYKISATDSCGNESELSPVHKSIHLIANLGLNNEVNLNWDEYIGFEYYEYEIYRGRSLTELFSIRTISASIRSWSDKSAPSGQNFYRILVVKPESCFPTFNKKSLEFSSPFSNFDEETLTGTTNPEEDGFNIYPNPFQDQATLTFSNPQNQSYTLYITDLSGKRYRIVSDITSSTFTIEKGNLSEGVYFIELIGPEIYRGKILIE